MQTRKIIVVGESWHGSDSTGLARGFRELGHIVELIGTDQFFPISGRKFWNKVHRRLSEPLYRQLFNKQIVDAMKAFNLTLSLFSRATT